MNLVLVYYALLNALLHPSPELYSAYHVLNDIPVYSDTTLKTCN